MQLSFFFFPKYLLEWGVVGHSEQFNVQEKKRKKMGILQWLHL